MIISVTVKESVFGFTDVMFSGSRYVSENNNNDDDDENNNNNDDDDDYNSNNNNNPR